jgi:branched-chain amino acid transport system ATP-binding protein
MTPRQVLSLGIVQVPQSHSLFPTMTVRENVRLGAYLLNDSARIERRLHEVEALFPIVKTRAREKAGNLSGGQQRLVEFARCLMLDPRVILLDESSMGLDPKTFKQVIETVKVMQSSGRTVVLVEQNARTELSLANNSVVLESGCVRLTGSHTDILNNPEIAHLYLGGTLSQN